MVLHTSTKNSQQSCSNSPPSFQVKESQFQKNTTLKLCQPSPHSPKQHSSYCEALREAFSKPIAEIQGSLAGYGSKSVRVSKKDFTIQTHWKESLVGIVLGPVKRARG